MRSESSVEAGVRKWLTKTGFPLQMIAARELERWMPERASSSTGLSQGEEWFDSRSGLVREIDLAVTWHARANSSIDVTLLATIECKAAEKPWVVLAGSGDLEYGFKHANIAEASIKEAIDLSAREVADCNQFLRSLHFPLGKQDAVRGSSIVEAHTDRKHEHNPAYKALLQAVASAHAGLAQYAYEGQSPGYVAALPIVVTSGPLVATYMDGDDVAVKEIESARIIVHPDRGKRDSQTVFVVQERYLTLLAQQVAAISEQAEDSWS